MNRVLFEKGVVKKEYTHKHRRKRNNNESINELFNCIPQ